MERNQVLAVLIIIVMVGSVGIYFLLAPPESNYQPSQSNTSVSSSYIIAVGDFEFIDVFSWIYRETEIEYNFQCHVTISDKTYLLGNVVQDATDGDNIRDMYRIHLQIQKDGNLTEHKFFVLEDIVFYADFRGISIDILVNKYNW